MGMEVPKPGPQHETLARLAGEWSGDETMHASAWCPEEQVRAGHVRSDVLEGFFVVSNYEQRSADEVTFRGHGVYSWDAREESYVFYWFDSMGGAGGVAKGHFERDTLTFGTTSPMGHHRYRYIFEGDDVYRFEMAMSQDGEAWQTMMTARYERVT